jgi:Ala-tRNA(Pro) deacylase
MLDSLGIGYLRIDHDATATVDDCFEVERILGIGICKNLFLCNAAKTAYYLLLMPGDKRYRAPLLSRQLNTTRLSFADAADMEKYLRITPGSVSVLGLMNDKAHAVRLLIDRDVLRHAFVGCHPCVNTSSLRVSLDDILNRFLPHTGHTPTVVEL